MTAWRLDPSGSEPLFRQLVDAVKRDVATGRLRAGERIPPVRELAKELLLNPNTVAKAYAVLESEGITASRRGTGTFVAAPRARPVLRSEECRRRFREALEAALADAVHLGLTAEEVERMVASSMKRFRFEGTSAS